MEFKEWPKISRLSRECIITEKIDGTNASIYIGENGDFLTGSRTQWITPEKDNYGFSRWAHENKEELLQLGIGHHFGEWWGNACQRGYGLPKGEKRFSLFNVGIWARIGDSLRSWPCDNPTLPMKTQKYAPACCHVVPILWEGIFDTFMIDGILKKMREQGSIASKGFMKPEGIVIYHKSSGVMFKKTLERDDEWKGKNKENSNGN